MNAKKYEDFVYNIIEELKIIENAKVYRNQKFSGIRQSGKYEVDIAVHYKLFNIIDVKLVIECKNWSKPVDRPVIQKIAQTRDAISAHKAAVVSPEGFTKEAINVAKDLGVALWIFAYNPPKLEIVATITTIYKMESNDDFKDLTLKNQLLRLIKFNLNIEEDSEYRLADFDLEDGYIMSYNVGFGASGIDKRLASTQISEILIGYYGAYLKAKGEL